MSEDTQQRRWYRRTVLSATAASLAGLAGCSSGGDAGGKTTSPTETPQSTRTPGQENSTTTPTEDETETSTSPSAFERDTGSYPAALADPHANWYDAEFAGPAGADALEAKWSYDTGSYNVQVLFDRGATYLYTGKVKKVGPSGSEQWVKSVDGIESGPYMMGNTLVFEGGQNRLIGLNRDDGSRQWIQSYPENAVSAVRPADDKQYLFLIVEDSTKRRLVEYSLSDESVSQSSEPVETNVSEMYPGLAWVVSGDEYHYFRPTDNYTKRYLVAFDRNNLSKAWEAKTSVPELNVQNGMYANGQLFVKGGRSDDYNRYFEARDPQTGKRNWQWKAPESAYVTVSLLAADDSHIYVLNGEKKKLVALSQTDGTKAWEYPTLSNITNTVIGRETVYVSLADGEKLLALDAETGEKKTTYGGVSKPMVIGNRLMGMSLPSITMYGPKAAER